MENSILSQGEGSFNRSGLEEEELDRMVYEYNMLNYRLSHDLRSPISTIQGLINLTRIDCSREQLEYLSMMETALQKQNSLMKNMYHLSSIHTSRLHYEPVNYTELINHITGEISQQNISWSITFDLKRSFSCDYEILVNLLLPIITNATQFIEKDKKVVTICVKTEDCGSYITIKDNGEGIDPRIQNQIYEMFFRGSSISNGSGLGLYIAKCAAQRLAAQISFTTDQNGTIFKVFIPTLEFQAQN